MADKIDELLTRGVEKIYPSKDALEKVLRIGKKLRIYLGMDPTATRLHVGHAIPLSILNRFAQNGHEAILLFGTGTVLVGDPSQRKEARNKITMKEIKENIKTWKKQVEPIIDFSKVTIRYNSDWLLKLTLREIIEIASHISAVQLFKRDNFQERLNKGDTVWFHETFYPLLQGYDSVVMDVDGEIGGTDQTFNMLVGRELLQKMKGKEKFVITNKMIVGTDRNKMSKSTDNCIWLTDSPGDMYGKLMSIPDSIVESYMSTITDLNFTKLSHELKPIDLKKQLAFEITRKLHGSDLANNAQNNFENTVQKRETPSIVPIVNIKVGDSIKAVDLLVNVKLVESKSKSKQLIKEGAVSIDTVRITDTNEDVTVTSGMIIKAGKRKFVKIK